MLLLEVPISYSYSFSQDTQEYIKAHLRCLQPVPKTVGSNVSVQERSGGTLLRPQGSTMKPSEKISRTDRPGRNQGVRPSQDKITTARFESGTSTYRSVVTKKGSSNVQQETKQVPQVRSKRSSLRRQVLSEENNNSNYSATPVMLSWYVDSNSILSLVE